MVDKSTSSAISKSFGLIPVYIKQVSGRMFALHYQVIDSSNQQWFLKCCPKTMNMKHLDMQLSIYNHLRTNNLTVPFMKSSNNGMSGAYCDNNLYACYSFIEHDNVAIPRRDAHVVGKVLGSIHKATQSLSLHGRVWARSIHDISDIRKDLVLWLDQIVFQPNDRFDHFLCHYSSLIQDTLDDLPSLSEHLFPHQVLYGDCNPQNILTLNGTVVGCIDFDNTTIGHPLEDIAEALFYFGGYINDTGWFPNRSLARQFLQGYLSVHPLPEFDAETLSRILRAQCIRQLSRFAGHWNLFKRAPGVKRYISYLINAISIKDSFFHPWYGLESEVCN